VLPSEVLNTVGELTNIIAGNAKRDLEEYRINISLPGVIVGHAYEINWPKGIPVITIPFTSEFGKFDVFGDFRISVTLIVTTVMLGFALVYSIVILVLFRNNIYHPAIKYVSAAVNITLVILSIAVYRLEPYPEYSQISQLARYSIVFLFYLFMTLNYNVKLALFAGVLATLEYFFFVVFGNSFLNLSYTFTGPDGILYASEFKLSEQLLKLVYILVGGCVAAVVAGRLRNLVNRVTAEHKEKIELEQSRQRLVEAVNAENRKYLDNVSDGLVLRTEGMLSGKPDKEAIDEAFREIHSLRGTMRTLGFRTFSELSQKVEYLLANYIEANAAS
jgi:hypothetical protein